MNFTTAEISSLIGAWIWPFFRIGALLMTAPITGAQTVPVRVRLMLAIAVTALVVPLLPPPPPVEPFSLPAITLIFQQLLVGVAMGFALTLVFSAIITGGQIIAMQMGLGFASMVDPQNGQQVPVLSQLYLMMSTLLFLGFDGHLVMIQLLVESFQLVPVSPTGIDRDGLWAVAAWGSRMFAAAVWLALPAVASLLVVNIAFGVMSKAAPQLHIFTIGFPITMIMGFLVVLFALPSVVPQVTELVQEGFALIGQVLGQGP